MTSREIVKRAVEFRKPERLPVDCNVFGMSDFAKTDWNQIGTGKRQYRQTYDEWGCLWVRTENDNMGQIMEHPLIEWSNMDSYKWPDPNDPAFYEGVEKKVEAAGDRYRIFNIFMLLFERIHALRGFENALTDLYLEREKLDDLADRIVDFNLGIMQNMYCRFGNEIDGMFFTEDWGTELSTFISPQLWREFFKPRYIKIFRKAREYGWHIWMHSCGYINAFMDDLINIGVNVFNLEQPKLLGIEEIGREFAGRVAFMTGCDIQHTLPFDTPGNVIKEAKLLLDSWGTEFGGFIFTMDLDNARDLKIPQENLDAMLQTFIEYDRWKN